MLVYRAAPGELIGAPAALRADPASAYQRFANLPAAAQLSIFDTLIDVHRVLAGQGWVAGDLYDGCLIVDFDTLTLHVVDLDTYRRGPSRNDMGRMFGSRRFMAPEEFEFGALLDQRTTVFTLGRTISVFLGDGSLEAAPFRGTAAQFAAMTGACRTDPSERLQTVAALIGAWRGDARP